MSQRQAIETFKSIVWFYQVHLCKFSPAQKNKAGITPLIVR